MLISEAVAEAMQTRACIKRKCHDWPIGIKIMPTNTSDCCVLLAKNKAPCRGWEPQAKDLIADDWEIVK